MTLRQWNVARVQGGKMRHAFRARQQRKGNPMNGSNNLSRRSVVIGGLCTLAAGAALVTSPQDWAMPSVPSRDRIDNVLQVVSEEFGVSVAELQSKSRAGRIASARRIGMYLAHRISGATPAVIGRRFGGRDYTNVLLAARKLQELAGTDAAQGELLRDLERRCMDMNA
ncbi:MAG: hypothetical protein K8F62_17870 [Pseudorhodoplanes sp.]|nr:hypothetical protein [Pseudorhodoplanes sp.]